MLLIRISSASCLIVVCADGFEYIVTAKCNVVSKMLNPNKISQSGSRTRALWVKATNPNHKTNWDVIDKNFQRLVFGCGFLETVLSILLGPNLTWFSETLKSEQNFPVRESNPGYVGESHKS